MLVTYTGLAGKQINLGWPCVAYVNRIPCGPQAAAKAAGLIGEGGVAVFPTDTVYGLGCDPYSDVAVRRIYRIKGREPSKPLPVLASSRRKVERIAGMSAAAGELADKFWPGPLTMVLDLLDPALESSMGLNGRIAVRVPSGRCIGMLLERCSLLVGTSANPSGVAPPTDPDSVSVDCDIMLDGGTTSGGRESTIVDICGEKVSVMRLGAVSEEELRL